MGTVTTSRIPCHCENWKQQILKAWISGIEPELQPRFQPVQNCKYKDILEQKQAVVLVSVVALLVLVPVGVIQVIVYNPNHPFIL